MLPNISYRSRLVIAVVFILTVIQGLNYIFVSNATRTRVVEGASDDLRSAQVIMERFIADQALAASNSARITSSDFAFKSEMVNGDLDTRTSVLANARTRINADWAVFLDLNARVATTTDPDALDLRAQFDHIDLIDASEMADTATAFGIGLVGQHLYLISVVAVDSPATIGYFVTANRMDGAYLAQATDLLPTRVQASVRLESDRQAFVERLPGADREGAIAVFSGDKDMFETEVDGEREVINVASLPAATSSAPVDLILEESIDAALRASEPLFQRLAALILTALVISVAAALLFAHSFNRPIENLTRIATQVENGRYDELPFVDRRDEIGRLSSAFSTMIARVKSREAELSFQASHDMDTGLLNRTALSQEMEHYKLPAATFYGMVGIKVLTLDDINHVFGRNIGLETARQIADRLRAAVPSLSFAARIDETTFAVALGVKHIEELIQQAQQISAVLQQPVPVGGSSLDLNILTSVAFDNKGLAPSNLVQMAESALFRCGDGGQRVVVYDPKLDEPNADIFTLMADVRDGLERGDFKLFLQPKISLDTGKIVQAEGLIRWFHPTRGFIPPDQFISLAERTGRIKLITGWVIEEAIRILTDWRQSGIDAGLAINLAVSDLNDQELPDRVSALLTEAGLGNEDLVFEITESELMQDPDRAIATLTDFHNRGVMLSVDDFGTGYSSLEYLRYMPVSELKIDRSFVRDIASNDADKVITRGAIDIARGLGLKTTAEGVEDESSVRMLRLMGCDTAQGYYFSKPIDRDAFKELWATWDFHLPQVQSLDSLSA